MKMITMWKEYYRKAIIPVLNWFKRYWKEYFLLSFVIGLGVYTTKTLFNKIYH